MRMLGLIACLLGYAAPVLAADVRSITIEPDKPVHLSNPHNWAKGCKPGWTRVTVNTYPKHGQVSVQTLTHKLGDFGGGRLIDGTLKECTGRSIRGVGLFYDPKDGYTGEDTFTVTFTHQYVPPLEVTYNIKIPLYKDT